MFMDIKHHKTHRIANETTKTEPLRMPKANEPRGQPAASEFRGWAKRNVVGRKDSR